MIFEYFIHICVLISKSVNTFKVNDSLSEQLLSSEHLQFCRSQIQLADRITRTRVIPNLGVHTLTDRQVKPAQYRR